MWRPDPLIEHQLRLPCSILLHREAGKRGYSCTPKKCHIGLNAGYWAEINQAIPNGVHGDMPWLTKHKMRFNLKLGTGPTPLHAALSGYQQLIPIEGDPVWALVVLEVELYFLAEAARVYQKAERTLSMLEKALAGL